MLSYAGPKELVNTASPPSNHVAAPPPSSTPAPADSSSSAIAMGSGAFASASAATDHVVSLARKCWADCRPWTEFHSTRTISVPQFAALSDRISSNLHYYRANYFVVAAFWLAFNFLFNIPRFLMAAVLFILLQRWAASRAAKNAGALSHRNMLITAFISLVIIWITDIGSTVIFSLVISAIYTTVHAALHVPDPVETEIATV